MQHNVLVATVWRDKKDVVTISTQSSLTTDQVLRRQKDGTRVCRALKPSTSTTATWEEWTRETSFASTIVFGSSVRNFIRTSFGSHLTPPSQVEEAVCLMQQVQHPSSAENDSVVLMNLVAQLNKQL